MGGDGAIRMCGHWLESLRRLKLSQRRCCCRAKCKSFRTQGSSSAYSPPQPLHYLIRVILRHCMLVQTACVLSIISSRRRRRGEPTSAPPGAHNWWYHRDSEGAQGARGAPAFYHAMTIPLDPPHLTSSSPARSSDRWKASNHFHFLRPRWIL